MAFIIDNTKVDFDHYTSLKKYETTHPFVKEIVDFLTDWNTETVPVIKVSTSGSTGLPKLMELSKASMILSAKKTLAHFELVGGDTALLALPVKYIAGKMMVVRALVGNLDLILVQPSNTPMTGVDAEVDFLPLTPYQFSESYNNDNECYKRVVTILLGGGPVNRSAKNIAKSINTRVVHGFGMTETITHIATRDIDNDYYKALPGVTFSLKDHKLSISADHLSQVIDTTDLAELVSTTAFIWKGRADNIINSGGIKISPELLEEKLAGVITDNFFVTGEQDEKLGMKVVLYIESVSPAKYHNIENRLRAELPRFEVPKEVYLLPRFLKTETSKVKRKETVSTFSANKISV